MTSLAIALVAFVGCHEPTPLAAAPVQADAPAAQADAPASSSPPTDITPKEGRSTGVIENFREVLVDAPSFPDSVQPVAPSIAPTPTTAGPMIGMLLPERTTLPVVNERSSWADVFVNDVHIGTIEPLTTGAVHDLHTGRYELRLQYQNGFSQTDVVQTVQMPASSDED